VLRRTLVPTQHLIHKLQSTHSDRDSSQGFLSPLTVLYLSDVHDHISTVVEDMYSLSEDAKDLIELVRRRAVCFVFVCVCVGGGGGVRVWLSVCALRV
jgi:Mg2+ and Co2+ transporter CorA